MPRLSPPSSSARSSHLTPSGQNELKVLLVGLGESDRNEVRLMLKRIGVARITEVSTSGDARELIAEQSFAFIVSSFLLSDGSAVNLLHQVRDLPNRGDTPFIILVSSVSTRDLEFDQNPNTFFLKTPLSQAELSQKIGGIVNSSFAAPPERTYSLVDEPGFHLVVCPEEDGSNEITRITMPGYEKLRLLVVDDDRVRRTQTTEALHALGFTDVVDLESAMAALKRIETGRVDYVVCESYPWGLTGLELLRAIRTNELFQSLPFVMFTAHAEQEQVLRALRYGCDDYVIKPVTLSGLAQSFNRVLQQEELNRASERKYKGICLDDEEALANAENLVKSAYDPRSKQNPLKEMRVLLIDEDEKFRRICGSLLKRLGFSRVSETSSGASALKKIENRLADIVFCDTFVRQVSALEILRNVRAIDYLKELPFVVLSESCTLESVVAALRAGVTDYVVKPCTIETLAESVSRILSKQSES